MTAAEPAEMCLLRAMDSLWFYHTILFTKNTLFPNLPSGSPGFSSKSCSRIPGQETSPVASITTCSQDETTSQESEDDENRTTRLIPGRIIFGRIHHSAMRLQKTMSYKSLAELELEEVKGFMDLGFNFKKEELGKHLMKLIPGLQRITTDHNYEDDDYEKKGVMRPYLSEAWAVKRPDSYSPLMNVIRVASFSSNEDIKRHLKCWAHTVALSIHQECC